MITIHESGTGGEKLKIVSYYNGGAYNIAFGEAGSPMRNIYFQGDDATQLRAEYDALETANPDKLCRDLWFIILDDYL